MDARAQDQAELMAGVLLEDFTSYEGGSLFGPSPSRGTWYSFGDIEPIAGPTFAAFSTGDADGPPVPGTDLGVLDAGDDLAGLNLTLRVPDEARSLRLSYRLVVPSELSADSLEDRARVSLQGEPIALDPWLLNDAGQDFADLRPSPDLSGTYYASPVGSISPWVEVALAVSPGDQLLLRIEVEDDPSSDLGDLLLLADRLVFDSGQPEGGSINPGRIPMVHSTTPERIRPKTHESLVLNGRDLADAEVLSYVLRSETGEELAIPVHDVDVLSGEQVRLAIPPLAEGSWGLVVTWEGGRIHWPSLFEVREQVPRILEVQPSTGPVEGGGLALIRGLGFDEVTSLRWDGITLDNYSQVSNEMIEVVVPAGDPGPIDVSIFAAGGFHEAPGLYRYGRSAAEIEQTAPPSGVPPSACSSGGSPPEVPARLCLLLLLLLSRVGRGRRRV